MSETLDFLKMLWGGTGPWYCLMTLRDGGKKFHHVYSSIEETERKAIELGAKFDTYFTLFSLKEEKVKNKAKEEKGQFPWSWRTNANMNKAKCFWADLDVGTGKPYATGKDAFDALIKFCTDLRMPAPFVVKSGLGLHVYWPFDEAINSSDWRPFGNRFKKVCEHYGLKVDPTRAADISSVLRVPGTYHFKDKTNPRPVTLFKKGIVSSFASLTERIDRAYTLVPDDDVGEGTIPSSNALNANTVFDSKPVTILEVNKACRQSNYMTKYSANLTEPEWYAHMGMLLQLVDGEALVHKIHSRYDGYDKDQTDRKIEQWQAKRDNGTSLSATTCGKLRSDSSKPELCEGCWFAKKKGGLSSSPVAAGRERPIEKEKDEAVIGSPKGYSRMANGGVSRDIEPVRIIYPYDLYPISTELSTFPHERRTSTWVVGDAHGKREVMFLSDEIWGKDIGARFANKGVILQYDDTKYVREYMIAYIQKLRDEQKEHTLRNQLGWTGSNDEFVLPYAIMHTDGRETAPHLSRHAKNTVACVSVKGSEAVQIKAMDLYKDPEIYVRQQFFMMCALGAPAMNVTELHGCTINASGEPGSSKSTSLKAAGAFYGDPSEMVKNGVSGSTANSAQAVFAASGSIPSMVDEITKWNAEKVSSALMAFTQENKGKERLERTGESKAQHSDPQSSLLLTTSNTSLNDVISQRNASSSAASLRLIEVFMQPIVIPGMAAHESKAAADKFLYTIKHNYGHIGRKLLRWMVTNRETVRARIEKRIFEIERDGGFAHSERYWSVSIAVAIEMGAQAHRMGLIPWRAEPVLKWVMESLVPSIRTAVKETFIDGTETLLSYMTATASNMLVVNRAKVGLGWNVVREPRGELTSRFEFMERTIYIEISKLKAYCVSKGISYNMLLLDLERSQVVTRTKKTLGEGCEQYNFGQVPCIMIGLDHPALKGISLDAAPNLGSNVVEMRRTAAA